jgi:uncharacterized protein YjcR
MTRRRSRRSIKLNESQVREIRRIAAAPWPEGMARLTYDEIGAQYGVSKVMIHKIVRRKSWTHLDEGV